MLNYYYIYYNTNNTEIDIEDPIHDIIYDILLRYSFPSFMNSEYELTPDEIESIKDNEFEFIKSKIDSNITIIQIPRIIYDLFNMISIIETRPPVFDIDVSPSKNDFIELCSNISRHNNEYKSAIINLNNNFYKTYIQSNILLTSNNCIDIISYWKSILNNIMITIFDNKDLLKNNIKYFYRTIINETTIYKYE